jgi:putative oxidoreductase
MSIERTLAPWQPQVLSVLRFMAGLEILQHGTAKILHFPAVAQMAHVQIGSLAGVGGLIELIGGTLMVIGLFTRPTAFILCGFTAVAYFMVHASQSFFPLVNKGELAVLYCFVFLYIFAAGPGPWSIDAARGRS